MASPPRLYPTDLSDAEWVLLEPLIRPTKPGVRPAKWSRRSILDGTWEQLNSSLRECEWIRQGRHPQPSGCIMDSRSVKTTSVGDIRGYDGANKLSGCKWHLLVDTLEAV